MSRFACLSKVSSFKVTEFLSEFSLSSDLQRESSLGILDYNAVTDAATGATTQVKKRNSNQKWSASERFKIGKYAAQNGHVAAVRKFSVKEKPLNKRSVRRFAKLYKGEKVKKKKRM